MAKNAMVIDLRKCVGCGACALACKTENNTSDREAGQTFNWADYIFKNEGRFPNTRAATIPVLCNHCSNAACVEACPVTPKAMFKTENGTTMHNDERCIGCRACQGACPYSSLDVDADGAAYSVISFNQSAELVHAQYKGTSELISDGTSSGAAVAQKSGALPPHRTAYDHPEYEDVRREGVTEKCYFCDHRQQEGELPYCVVSCPSSARIFGDLDDSRSEVSRLLRQFEHTRLKEEAGTEPNVYYIRSYKAD